MLALLEKLVRAESPSLDKAAVDCCGNLLAAEWRRLGARVTPLRQRERGDHLRVEWAAPGLKTAGQILLLGHFDTVHPLGSLDSMPWRIAAGRAYGPGTYDMKSGLVIAYFAVAALRDLGLRPAKRIVAVWNTDEEIGSQTSRAAIEREARSSDAVLVCEPSAGPDGKLKIGRKGVGEAEIIVTGRASHAGLNPEQGVNAVHELALQIERLRGLNRPERGTTVNVDVVEGGTRVNVIAAAARGMVDLRATSITRAQALERRLRSLRPILPGAKIEVRGGFNRVPLEPRHSRKLFGVARRLGREIGLELEGAFVGGGSDGNLTAALGVPTLDGLGAIGDGAHAAHEHIVISSLPERAALLAALLLAV
jgi:glutamate carboxypeptidase